MSSFTADVGDQVRIPANFTDVDGNAADPTEVTISHEDPSGNETDETYNGGAGNVQRSAVGNYYLDLTIDEAGRWKWRRKGTGAVVAASEGIIRVRSSWHSSP